MLGKLVSSAQRVGRAGAERASPTTEPTLEDGCADRSLSLQLTCLVGGIGRTNCSVLDIDCQCRSTELKAVVTDCLLVNCTMQDGLGEFQGPSYFPILALQACANYLLGILPLRRDRDAQKARDEVQCRMQPGFDFPEHLQYLPCAGRAPRLTACTTRLDLPDTSRFTAQECNLSHKAQTTDVIVIMSVLYGAAILFILLRTFSKMMTRTFWTEDYVIIASTALAAVPFGCMLDSEYPPLPCESSPLPEKEKPHLAA